MEAADAKDAAATIRRSPVLHVLARAGLVVLGVLHVMIGVLALVLTRDTDDVEADQSGAMLQLARTPIGGVLLWCVAIGLFALCVWEVVSAILVRRSSTPKKWARRIQRIGIAVAYAVVGATALIFAVGGRTSTRKVTQDASATLIALPGGVVLLGAVGVATFAVGIGFIVGGFTRRFAAELQLPAAPLGPAIVILGVVGYLGKGLGLGVLGVLIVVGAVLTDPRAAAGLDGALTRLVAVPFGEALVWIVGIGLIVYGVFCLARARYAGL